MKKYLFALLLACNTYLSAAGWQPTATIIPLGAGPGSSLGAYFDVTVAYFPAIKKVVAAWADVLTNYPYYSTYDGIADMWSTAALISSTFTVEANVNLQSFPFKKILVAAWSDQSSHLPYYSYFDGTVWTTPQVFVIGDPTIVHQDIGLAYDKVGRRIFAAWPNPNNSSAPTYSTFGVNLQWTTPTEMYVPLNFPVENNINLSYDIASGEVIAAWSLGATNKPTYSSFTGGGWSEPAAIPTGGSNGVNDDVRLVFDRTMNVVLAAWADFLGNHTGYGAYYNGSWTATGAFNLDGSIGIYDNVSLGYNLITGAAFAVWQDLENSPGTGKPFYNIEPGPIVGAIPPGLSTGVNYNVNIAYDQNSGKMVAVWTNYHGPQILYYNTYQ